MTLDIRGRNIGLSQALRDHVTRRVRFALGRFGGRVARVTTRLGDLNGPRGGVDKCCRIVVTLRAEERVLVEDADTDMYAAIDRAAERAGRAVWRRLAQRREGAGRHVASESA